MVEQFDDIITSQNKNSTLLLCVPDSTNLIDQPLLKAVTNT